MFIPAFEGTRGSVRSYGRPSLFDGKADPLTGDDGRLEAELESLLG
jgi:hypothetical protein